MLYKLKNNIISKYLEPIIYSYKLMKDISFSFMLIRIVCSLLIAISSILNAFIDKIILNLLVENQIEIKIFGILCGCGLLINLVVIILGYIDEYIEGLQDKKLEKYINELSIECSTKASISIYDDKNFYDKLLLLQNGFRSLSVTFWKVLNGTSAVFSFIISLYMFINYNIFISICLIIISLPYACIRNKFSKIFYINDIEQMNNERKMDYVVEISVNKEYSQLIRLYNLGKILKEKYKENWEKVYDKYKYISKKRKNKLIIFSFIPKIILYINSLFLINQILSQKLSLGDYTFYVSLAIEILSSINIMINSFNNIYENRMILYNLKEFKTMCNPDLDKGKKELTIIEKIELQHVFFRYPNTNHYIFNDLNIKIEAGKKYCILGVNGSGKSTLIKLLLRFYDVTEGNILINGYDIKEYKIESLREQFSVCFQNQKNFAFSLRDNIDLLHNSKTDESSLINLLKKCDINNIFEKEYEKDSNKYLDYSISKFFEENGFEMSGGENQRVTIARALYRDANILILDEASASIDTKAEKKLLGIIEEFTKNKTLIYITHHMYKLDFFDNIFVIDEGKIIESGTFYELLKLDGKFKVLYKYNIEK